MAESKGSRSGQARVWILPPPAIDNTIWSTSFTPEPQSLHLWTWGLSDLCLSLFLLIFLSLPNYQYRSSTYLSHIYLPTYYLIIDRTIYYLLIYTYLEQTLGHSGGQKSLVGRVGHDLVTQQQQQKFSFSIIYLFFNIHLSLYQWCVCVCAPSLHRVRLWDLMDWSLPGSSVHGIFQARILEQVAISFSRAPSWLRGRTCISCVFCVDKQILYHWVIWKAYYLPISLYWSSINLPTYLSIDHLFFYIYLCI